MLARWRGRWQRAETTGQWQQAPWRYKELLWESGAVGQGLYLLSEAHGLRGTGKLPRHLYDSLLLPHPS